MSSFRETFADWIRWAVVTAAGPDTGQFAVQQISYLGKTANTLIVFPFGLHANVTPDSLALLFSVQGNANNAAAIAWTPKDRPLLLPGECAFYHPPTDALIKWDEGGNLVITTGNNGTVNVTISCAQATLNATSQVTVNSPLAHFSGDIRAVGDITSHHGLGS